MIHLNDDGSITIDFAAGPVTVSAPTFGAMKRLRSDRVKLARQSADDTAKWEADHPRPEGDNEATAAEVVRWNEDRLLATEEANLAGSVAWWRLVLVGDDTFKRLTDDPVPDPDEWPAALIYDFRAIPREGATFDELLAAQPLIERVFRHWGRTSAAMAIPSP